MITVGKEYRLFTLELTDTGYDKASIDVTVTGRDGHLIEVNGCEIINTGSPLFHSLVDLEAAEAFNMRTEDVFNAVMSDLSKDLK